MNKPRDTHRRENAGISFPLRTIPRRKPYFAPGAKADLFTSLRGGKSDQARETADLEAALAGELGLQNPAVAASGRIALRLLLETSGLKPGAEVLVPGYTFGLLFPAIEASGFTPIPVDIDPLSFQMDSTKVESAVTEHTGAILATHIFGEPCEIEDFVKIAEKHKLLLIEDCAQALGARRGGAGVGSFGDAAISSFDISKPLQGIRGGVAFGRNADWIARVRERIAGSPTPGPATAEIIKGFAETALVGSPLWRGPMMLFSNNSTRDMLVKLYRKGESSESAPGMKKEIGEARLPGPLARAVRENLPSLGKRLERRRRIRETYIETLSDILSFQRTSYSNESSCHMVVATTGTDVTALRRFLAKRGIDAAIREEIADNMIAVKNSATEAVFKSAIALPIYCDLGDDDLRRVIEFVRLGYNKHRNA